MRSQELRSNLRSSVADGAAFSLMVGLGETYLPAFALALGMGGLTAGLVAGVPVVAGGRAVTLLLLRRVPAVEFEPVPVALRIDSVRPSTGALDRPILASIAVEPMEEKAGVDE